MNTFSFIVGDITPNSVKCIHSPTKIMIIIIRTMHYYLEVHGYVVTSRVISPLIGVIIIVTLLITPLITTHEPPSMVGP